MWNSSVSKSPSRDAIAGRKRARNSLSPLFSSTRSEKSSQNPATTGADRSREPNRTTTRSSRALLHKTAAASLSLSLPGSSSSSLLRRPYRRSPGLDGCGGHVFVFVVTHGEEREAWRLAPGRKTSHLTSPRLVVFCGVRSSSSLFRHPPAACPAPEEDAAVRLVPSHLHFGDCWAVCGCAPITCYSVFFKKILSFVLQSYSGLVVPDWSRFLLLFCDSWNRGRAGFRGKDLDEVSYLPLGFLAWCLLMVLTFGFSIFLQRIYWVRLPPKSV